MPPFLFLLAVVGAGVLQARLPRALGLPSFAVAIAAGTLVLVSALLIAGAALLEMRRHRTTVEPWQRPSALVTTGIFAFTRNPLYLAQVLIVTAFAFMANSLWIVLAAAALFVALDHVVIRCEERLLEDVFGQEYVDYKHRVRRWA